MSDANTATFRLAPGHRLQWEEAQGRHVLLYPEGMVELDEPAAAVLARLVEPKRLATLIKDLEQEFEGSELEGDVRAFVEEARAKGWVQTLGG